MTSRQAMYTDYYAATAGRCGHIWIKPGRTQKKLHQMAKADEMDRRRLRMKQLEAIFKEGPSRRRLIKSGENFTAKILWNVKPPSLTVHQRCCPRCNTCFVGIDLNAVDEKLFYHHYMCEGPIVFFYDGVELKSFGVGEMKP